MNNVSEYHKTPQQREYKLKCKVKFFKKTVTEVDLKKAPYERVMVLLVPQENDQRTMCFNAWLRADQKPEGQELVAYVALPVDSTTRLSLHRAPDEKNDRHYLLVRYVGIEDVIKKHLKEGAVLNLTVLGEDDDEAADGARDAEHQFRLKE